MIALDIFRSYFSGCHSQFLNNPETFMPAPTIQELRSLSDRELIARHDDLAQGSQLGLSYYLDEIARRKNESQNEILLSYTKANKKDDGHHHGCDHHQSFTCGSSASSLMSETP